jgi:hypothetical protein
VVEASTAASQPVALSTMTPEPPPELASPELAPELDPEPLFPEPDPELVLPELDPFPVPGRASTSWST